MKIDPIQAIKGKIRTKTERMPTRAVNFFDIARIYSATPQWVHFRRLVEAVGYFAATDTALW